jgi:transposase
VSKIHQYNASENLAILKEYETSRTTLVNILEKYNIAKCTFYSWRRRYKLYGNKGLEIRTHNKSYSSELKLLAVQDYLSGNYSQDEIDIYEIQSRTQLRNWINKYNSHSSLTSYKSGGTRAMTKGRNTSWEERIEIVLYCLSQNRDYHHTADMKPIRFHISKFING